MVSPVVRVFVVAGSLTTVLAVAPLIAEFMDAAVIVCPASVHPEAQELELLQHKVLQPDVVQLAHVPEGTPPEIPTLVKSIILDVSITSAYIGDEKTIANIKIMYKFNFIIGIPYLKVPPDNTPENDEGRLLTINPEIDNVSYTA